MHGLKLGFYLDPSNETRRLMWTLAHAHGTLVALVHLAFAAFLTGSAADDSRRIRFASRSLVIAGFTLPAGFLLGGAVVYGGDPSLGILLVPVGALALAVAVATIAVVAGKRTP